MMPEEVIAQIQTSYEPTVGLIMARWVAESHRIPDDAPEAVFLWACRMRAAVHRAANLQVAFSRLLEKSGVKRPAPIPPAPAGDASCEPAAPPADQKAT